MLPLNNILTRQEADSTTERVLLIYPKTGIDVPGISIFLPLSVLHLANALQQAGFQTEIIDQRLSRDWKKRTRAAVKKGLLLVGISAMTGAQIKWGLKAAKIVRELDSDIPLVWGGIHASVLPKETLSDAYVDIVVTGPGEIAIQKLAKQLSSGDRKSAIGAICHQPQEEQALWHGGDASRHFDIVQTDDYLTPIMKDISGLAHVTSVGCPHKCGYCYNNSVNNSKWRALPGEIVVEQLTEMYRRGVTGVLFFDDNFFVNKARVEEIAKAILQKGLELHIKADCRADYIVRYDDSFLRLIRKAGFELLYIGAESGSNRLLEMMNKGVSVEKVRQCNTRLLKAGIRPHYSFMAGLPGESIDEMRQTVQLMLDLEQEHPGAYLSPIKAYVPYPGTELYNTALEYGFEAPHSLAEWSRFDWLNCPKPWLSAKEARFVEKIVYVTMGLDQKLVELSGINQSRFSKFGYLRFSNLCRKRCSKPNMGLVPELPLVNLIKKFKSS